MELGDIKVAWSYKPLWHMLIDKGLKKTELLEKTGINAAALSKLSKSEAVHLKVLERICKGLDCRIEDIVEYVPDDNQDNN